MGLKSRQKGKGGEREACEALHSVFPGARRRLGQERDAEDNGRDLDGTAPFVIQVKRHATVPRALRLEALGEAEDAIRAGAPGPAWYGLALWREDHGRWTVTCRLGTLIDAPGDLSVDIRRLAYGPDDALTVDLDLEEFLEWWRQFQADADSFFAQDVAKKHQEVIPATTGRYTINSGFDGSEGEEDTDEQQDSVL